MSKLFVGLDCLAGLRQAGSTRDPDPVVAAALAELAGAGGICVSVGRERGEIQERDVRLLRETVRTVLALSLPPHEEWVKLALAVRPDLVTLAPEGREGYGGVHGLDVEDRRAEIAPIVETLKSGGMDVAIMVDPAPVQVKAAHRAGAAAVLLHTGRYGWAADSEARTTELEGIVGAAKIAHRIGLAVHAGGSLSYQSLGSLARIAEIEAVHVGHSLIARAVLVGMAEAVRELVRILSALGARE